MFCPARWMPRGPTLPRLAHHLAWCSELSGYDCYGGLASRMSTLNASLAFGLGSPSAEFRGMKSARPLISSPKPNRSPTHTEKVVRLVWGFFFWEDTTSAVLAHSHKTLSGRKWNRKQQTKQSQIHVFDNMCIGMLIFRFMFFLRQQQFNAWLELECTA